MTQPMQATSSFQSTPEIVLIRLQNAALLSIFEQYQRRSESSPSRLVGVLLGAALPNVEADVGGASVSKSFPLGRSSTVPQYIAEARHCFPVPHSEVGEQVSINVEYLRSRMELHRKCYSKESSILGWFCISHDDYLPKDLDRASFEKNESFIREFFSREVGLSGAPVSLQLSIRMHSDGAISYEAIYGDVKNSDGLSKHAVPVEIAFGLPDLYAVNILGEQMLKGASARVSKSGKFCVSLPNENALSEGYNSHFQGQIDTINSYIRNVEEGKQPEDSELVKEISKVLRFLGMDGSAGSRETTLDDKKSLSNILSLLKTQIAASDQMLLGQSLSSLSSNNHH